MPRTGITTVYANEVTEVDTGDTTNPTNAYDGDLDTYATLVKPSGNTNCWFNICNVLGWKRVSIGGTIPVNASNFYLYVKAGKTGAVDSETTYAIQVDYNGTNITLASGFLSNLADLDIFTWDISNTLLDSSLVYITKVWFLIGTQFGTGNMKIYEAWLTYDQPLPSSHGVLIF